MNLLRTILVHNHLDGWRIVNDGVMGGKSQSKLEWQKPGYLVFSGVLSLENNGGFASAQYRYEFPDFSEYQGLRLRVRGDGNTYSFRLRMQANRQRVNYAHSFRTESGQWLEVECLFDQFQAQRRGMVLTNELPLDASQLCQIGWLISDKQAGPFRLEIAEVELIER